MFTLYILYSKKLDRYYVGNTNDLDRRTAEHNRKKGKYTDKGIPWEIVYTESFGTKKEARMRELFIKRKKSRSFIEELISAG